MIPYIVILLFAVAMAAFIQSRKGGAAKVFLWILILVLTAFVGLRFNVGTDYGNYFSEYFHYTRLSWKQLMFSSDPGIKILYKAGSYILDLPFTMFIIAAAIFCVLYVTSIHKYTDNFILAVFLFFGTGTFLDSMNGIRQAIAMAIIFYGFRYIKNKQFWKYLFTIVIASLFHSTAILMLILYFLFNMKFSPNNVFLLIFASIVLAFSTEYLFDIAEFITGKEIFFEYSYFTDSVNLFRVAVAIVPCFLVAFISPEARKQDAIYCNMLIFNAALLIATYNSTYLARIAMYSTSFVCIGIAQIVKRIQFKKDLKSLLIFVMIGAYTAYYCVLFMRTADLYPYRTIFDYFF